MRSALALSLLLSGCVWLNPFEPYDEGGSLEPCVTTIYVSWSDTTMSTDSVTYSDPDSTGACAEVGS